MLEFKQKNKLKLLRIFKKWISKSLKDFIYLFAYYNIVVGSKLDF